MGGKRQAKIKSRKGGDTMKLIIEGSGKEIADLVQETQNRPKSFNAIIVDNKILIREPYQRNYRVVGEVREDQRLKQDKNSRRKKQERK